MTEKKFTNSPVLLLISGPAGCGKTTLCERLTAAFPSEISRAITCTTRPPRCGEKNGVDYFFLSKSEFESGIAAGDFLEFAHVHTNLYGVRHAQIRERLDAGKNVLLNLDVQGAATVRQIAASEPILKKSLVSVFILPPNSETLRERLCCRGTDGNDEISRRMEVAKSEMERWHEYDFCFISGTKEEDFAKISAIYTAAKMRV